MAPKLHPTHCLRNLLSPHNPITWSLFNGYKLYFLADFSANVRLTCPWSTPSLCRRYPSLTLTNLTYPEILILTAPDMLLTNSTLPCRLAPLSNGRHHHIPLKSPPPTGQPTASLSRRAEGQVNLAATGANCAVYTRPDEPPAAAHLSVRRNQPHPRQRPTHRYPPTPPGLMFSLGQSAPSPTPHSPTGDTLPTGPTAPRHQLPRPFYR